MYKVAILPVLKVYVALPSYTLSQIFKRKITLFFTYFGINFLFHQALYASDLIDKSDNVQFEKVLYLNASRYNLILDNITIKKTPYKKYFTSIKVKGSARYEALRGFLDWCDKEGFWISHGSKIKRRQDRIYFNINFLYS